MRTTTAKICAVLALFTLSACAGGQPASRGTLSDEPAFTLLPQGAAFAPGGVQVMQASYRVSDVRVVVPRTLRSSEANSFYPSADIVWRGEPRGDRHAQVTQIFTEAMLAGTAGMVTGPEVILEIAVTRFHCLTEKTRFTVGGLHSMKFDLTVRDAATGAVLDGPRAVVADVRASGGAAAIAEDQAGRTQRVVVVERLVEVIRREMSAAVTGPAAEAALVSRAARSMATTATGL